MLCRLAASSTRRLAAASSASAAGPGEQALLSTVSLVVCGRPSSSSAAAAGSHSTAAASPRAFTAVDASIAAAAAASPGGHCAAPVPSRARSLSSSANVSSGESADNVATSSPTPKLVFGIPKVNDDVIRTPPMEEEDPGPVIREMRVQIRPPSEQGSRGCRRIRRLGKVPGIVYSNNDAGAKEEDLIPVKVDKIVLDREIRRLGVSFDNTVYDLVIEGGMPIEEDDAEGVSIKVQESPAGDREGAEGAAKSDAGERRELVLANQSRLHPVFRTLLSVNWIRYKAGRRYPIPIKFINHDLNDSFRRGAYIRRLKTHQHIILPEDPEQVPKWLYLDLEFVRSGSKLRVSDIMMPEGTRLHRGNEASIWNEVVCTIKGKKVFASDSDDEEGGVDDEV